MSALTCVILEFDSHSIRVGFAGEMTPRVEAKVQMEHICEDTVLTVLNSVMIDLLQIKLKGCKLLIIEPLLCTRRVRNLIYRTFIHSFQLVSLCMMPNMMMPLLAAGASSGMVVHLGRDDMSVVCFLHGRLLRGSIRDMAVGVRHACDRWYALLKTYIAKDVRRRLTEIEQSEDVAAGEITVHLSREFADRLFFQCARVDATAYCEMDVVDLDDPDDTDSHWYSTGEESDNGDLMHFHASPQEVSVLLNGMAISYSSGGIGGRGQCRFNVPQRIRYECLQCLIDGRDSQDLKLDDEHKGVFSLIVASLDRCCHESRAVLLNNIIFSGDGALVEGLTDCICAVTTKQLRRRFADNSPATCLKSVLAPNAPDLHPAANPSGVAPSYSVWLGGSVFASIKGNDKSFVSVADICGSGLGTTAGSKTFTASSIKTRTRTTAASVEGVNESGAGNKAQLYQFSAPDWMSASAVAEDTFAFVFN